MEAKLVQERVAQYAYGTRGYLNRYECPACRCEMIKTKSQAKQNPRCLTCGVTKHGMTGTKLYTLWQNMKRRCLSPCSGSYMHYGGRGIQVCSEWMEFGEFLDWATKAGWTPGLEIDRIDVNGHYEPSNCRFVTRQVNTQNQRRNKLRPDDIREIRRMLDSGLSCFDVATSFGVSSGLISHIKTGRKWSNII